MNAELLQLLDLKPDAAEVDVVAAVAVLKGQNAALQAKLASLVNQQRAESEFDQAVAKRMVSGLTRKQAEDCERRQREFDAQRTKK
jgi:hypothetical protein